MMMFMEPEPVTFTMYRTSKCAVAAPEININMLLPTGKFGKEARQLAQQVSVVIIYYFGRVNDLKTSGNTRKKGDTQTDFHLRPVEKAALPNYSGMTPLLLIN